MWVLPHPKEVFGRRLLVCQEWLDFLVSTLKGNSVLVTRVKRALFLLRFFASLHFISSFHKCLKLHQSTINIISNTSHTYHHLLTRLTKGVSNNLLRKVGLELRIHPHPHPHQRLEMLLTSHKLFLTGRSRARLFVASKTKTQNELLWTNMFTSSFELFSILR